MSTIITGTVASPGIVMGKAYIYRGTSFIIPKYKIEDDYIDSELSRFAIALHKTKNDIKEIEQQIEKNLSKEMASIFSSHIMVLEDPQISEKAKEIVIKEKRNIEWVLNDISLELINSLKSIDDEYMRERIIDISDIHKRLISNLLFTDTVSLADLDSEVIIFAQDLTPSDTAEMNKEKVLGFVTDRGGRTSHTAIMARALEIPAIVGSINATSTINDGDYVILDAIHGQVIVNPSKKEIDAFNRHQKELKKLETTLAELTHLPSVTVDDVEVAIVGNIELPEEKKIIKDHGAQGIGLFRSEFLFLDKILPDEEKQFNAYKEVVEYFNPLPVTIRTLDVGGDKIYSFNNKNKERNPFLGCRAIRFCFENIELFRTQLRAILRASHYGNLKLMFPMISTVGEIIDAREIVEETMQDLKKAGIPYNENLSIGIMIEVPSAAINADLLSKYCDFFSVGTNDLVQYTLAVDRISESIAYLYNPANLAVLRLLKYIVSVSEEYSVPLSICGEMAGEPLYTMLLLGLGFRNLSMSPTLMYQIKRIIRSVTIEECEKLVEEIMTYEKTEDVDKKLMELMTDKFPKIFS